MSQKVTTAIIEAATALIFLMIMAIPFMVLWNVALVPAITVLKTISWSQAFGFLGLAVFLRSL